MLELRSCEHWCTLLIFPVGSIALTCPPDSQEGFWLLMCSGQFVLLFWCLQQADAQNLSELCHIAYLLFAFLKVVCLFLCFPHWKTASSLQPLLAWCEYAKWIESILYHKEPLRFSWPCNVLRAWLTLLYQRAGAVKDAAAVIRLDICVSCAPMSPVHPHLLCTHISCALMSPVHPYPLHPDSCLCSRGQ